MPGLWTLPQIILDICLILQHATHADGFFIYTIANAYVDQMQLAWHCLCHVHGAVYTDRENYE